MVMPLPPAGLGEKCGDRRFNSISLEIISSKTCSFLAQPLASGPGIQRVAGSLHFHFFLSPSLWPHFRLNGWMHVCVGGSLRLSTEGNVVWGNLGFSCCC